MCKPLARLIHTQAFEGDANSEKFVSVSTAFHSRSSHLWRPLPSAFAPGAEVCERQPCQYLRAPGMWRLDLAATMAADTAVIDSIVATSASRLPELGPHGEGW